MRDIFILTAIIILALAALRRPQIGILAWLWISVMNPHRLSYGFIYSMPLLDGIVAITLLSCLIHWKDRAPVRYVGILKIVTAFYVWCTLTTIFSVDTDLSFEKWLAYTKTMLLFVVILLFMNRKHWIISFVLVFVLSVGLTGFKGGIFTVLTGGSHRVWGPPGTAWGDNNGVSVAMLMIAPLTLGCMQLCKTKFQKLFVLGGAGAFFVTILGTQSRGGLVGLLAMLGFVVLRSQKKILLSIIAVIGLAGGYAFMPQSWHDRMATIQNYEEDGSANTRLIQWEYAIDISLERPLFGNGFDAFFHQPYYYAHVAHKDSNRAVHSNYFEVLGEQGYIGILMYLSIIALCVINARKYALKCVDRDDLKWAAALLLGLQFSIIGYAVNGLTVNMAYIDLFYYLIAMVVLLISYIAPVIEQDAKENITDKSIKGSYA